MKNAFTSLALLFLLVLPGFAQDTEIFLKRVDAEFNTIDVTHDSEGNSYILGASQGQAAVKRYNSAGILDKTVALTGAANPVAMTVGGNFLYVAGNKQIVRLDLETLVQKATTFQISQVNLPDMFFRDVVYVPQRGEIVAVAQNPGSRWPRIIRRNANLTATSAPEVTAVESAGVGGSAGDGSWVRAATVDDVGNVYVVGEVSGSPSGDLAGGANKGYIFKFKMNNTVVLNKRIEYLDIDNVLFNNGWLYVGGGVNATGSENSYAVSRFATTDASLSAAADSEFYIRNTDYVNLNLDNDDRSFKFNLAADASDNLYITGYATNGITSFNSGGEEYTRFSSTAEEAYVAKLNTDFEYQWVKSPIQSPFPSFGSHFRISWDAVNSRLWWAGSYSGNVNLSMQEGSQQVTLKSLVGDSVTQGFAASFEPDGSFTEVVDFTLLTDYGEDRVNLNGSAFGSTGQTFEVIVDSDLNIQTPRDIYQFNQANGTFLETDNIEGNQNIIDNADTQYSFLNFSVDSVVQAGEATVYSFRISTETTVKLEWAVLYALSIDSDFANTASRATESDGSLFLEPLNSAAAGSPNYSVGKHWIDKDSRVTLTINGYEDVLDAHPGLPIRYIPYEYSATGAFAEQVVASASFPQVEEVQQLNEFIMTGPSAITYKWKLQYGVDMQSSNVSVGSSLAVEYVNDFDGSVSGRQSSAEGSGTHWFDDGTLVRIIAPKAVDFGAGPLLLSGWLNGDSDIFSPAEDDFGSSAADFFSAAQLNAGFANFTYESEEYAGLEVRLDRPARVVWGYGDRIIFKTISVTDFIEFSPSQIADYGLLVNQEPTILPADSAAGGEVPTKSDYIWDPVTLRLFPLRPLVFDFDWPTDTGTPAKVNLTVVWAAPNYEHIADSPAVSLIPHPPEGQPDDLVFQEVAYTEGDGAANDSKEFTATQTGRTVLKFNRITPAGRGGTAQAVVELKVVTTSLWNSDLGTTQNVEIGQKITSSLDQAGLETGYVFFDAAAYNPFIYNSDAFIGEALWNFASPPGPIIPVNQNPTESAVTNDLFVVAWYQDPSVNDYMLWPYATERYRPVWPDASGNLSRIVISSAHGSESVAPLGSDQPVLPEVDAPTTFDPGRFEQVSVYNQPVSGLAGFNPNEEHALMAPSLRFADVAPRPLAAYALRDNDLNSISGIEFTSDPYVLVQFFDKAEEEFKMKVYEVVKDDSSNYPTPFRSAMRAGEPVIPYYPIGVVSGATLCDSTYVREGVLTQRTFWKDVKGTGWAVSGGGEFFSYFYYPLLPDFYWPDFGAGNADNRYVGDCVAWLPTTTTARYAEEFAIAYGSPGSTPLAQAVNYTTAWPTDAAVMKVGETLTFSGGEYAADNAGADGLPGLLAWAAGEVVYDDLNPDMREGGTIDPEGGPFGDDQDGNSFDNYTARIYPALEERVVPLPVAQFPTELLPATGRTDVDGTIYLFPELSSSLKKRIFYDPLRGALGMKGLINDKEIGDATLTAAPPAVYVLEANVMTVAERDELSGVAEDSPYIDIAGNGIWTAAINALFELSRNPNQLVGARKNTTAANGGSTYTVGLQSQAIDETPDDDTDELTHTQAQPYQALGPGLALFTNPDFLDPDQDLPGISYVTLAENNDADLGGLPITLHIIKVDRRERYRGAVKVVLSDNVFDENIILRHTGDFGANADKLVFDWWYRVEDGTEASPPDQIAAGTTNPWKLFPDPDGDGGVNFFQLKLKGNPQAPELLLADSLWFVRYRHVNEEPNDPITWEANAAETWEDDLDRIKFQWAGAGNSSPFDLDGDGIAEYQAQLAQGWVKRVLDAVNPYEARVRDFNGDSPATYASMIRQFGQRYEGPVALNPDKNVIENVGLIELYSTVLERARSLSIDLSTPVSTPGITNALLLASTRLADFYTLLGNEAYTDALDPMIGFGSDSVTYGSLAPTVFTFQNQLSSQIEEELGLLRGVYDFKARPVYNRLFWNFTKGEGEAAYATAYNLSDVTLDGFIDEDDAQVLYPQGHGDAWGHYLTAIRGQYELLNNSYFNWVSRSELYSLQDIVFDVDFYDERKFAQVAAAKAKAGSEIIQLTYRESYVEDPSSQWQGYIDTNTKRSWGVEGWARRAGQGAYFDWVTANALIPSQHPNSGFTGLRKVDRTTVKDIAVISANMNAVQQTFEDANNGFNPLGIAGNTVPFDIDPSALAGGGGVTHFEQIYTRAVDALNNAVAVFDYANEIDNLVRSIENNEIDFRRAVFEEDMAYKNELIDIFGTPYQGQIGAGKAYAAGYTGPDTSLYMYVDKQVRTIDANTVPLYASSFAAELDGESATFKHRINLLYVGSSNNYNDIRPKYAPSFTSKDNPSSWLNSSSDVEYTATLEDGITFDSGSSRVGLQNMDLPIKASGYTFEAPAEWGDRASPGKLQIHIAKMIQQEAALAQALADWDNYQAEVILQLRLMSARLDRDSSVRGLLGGKIANNTILGAGILVGKNVSRYADYFAELTPNVIEKAGEFVPKVLPTAGFSFSPGDALSAIRGATYTGAAAASGVLKAVAGIADAVVEIAELTKDLIDMGLDFVIDEEDRRFDFKEALVELENMVGDEGILRVNVFREQEALRQLSEEYRALLQQGARLIDEREAYNKRVAELTQRNRYQDMTFRVGVNAALQQHHDAFDLAARYTYLAAKAYDYETNLDPAAAGSARGILSDIVGERSLGYIDGVSGAPLIGKGGLSEQLAILKANFDTLKGQLGLNNPQTETGRFSLRQELFRISPTDTAATASDTAWRDVLENAKVDNLWDIPEFRRYCRPFAGYDESIAEPGIVIEFESFITSRKNFFGNTLAGGDSTYDPTNFATKIFSVGTWFEGYLSSGFDTGNAQLSDTPRIYLIPIGSDVMAYPSDASPRGRMWNVLDQKVPIPYPVLESNLDDAAWRPLDTLGGTDAEIRKFSSFRAYHDSGFNQSQMTFDTRLVGRSVWNTRWMLIIPGSTLNGDPEAGLETFINNISDIKLFFQTYGYSGN